MSEFKPYHENWWEGLSFSPGTQSRNAEKKELLIEVAEFMSSIRKPRDLEIEHKDLFTRVEAFVEEWGDKIEEDEQESFTAFVLWYKQLKDPKSKFELLDSAIESNILVEESLVRPGGKTYDSERQKFYPEQYQKKLPKVGAWIMIIAEYIPVQFPPERFGIYYAKSAATTQNVTPYGSRSIKVPYYRIKITTDQGDLCLWPHEYIIVEDIKEVMSGVGTEFELVRLGGDTNYDSAKVHYLGTRGIDQADVYNLLLASIGTTNYCYFKLSSSEYIEYYTFYFDCIQRGISSRMIERLWECHKTGKSLFKVNYTIEGKEVTEDEFNAYSSKNRQETDIAEHQSED